MNPFILALIVMVAISSPEMFLGILSGLIFCFVVFERCDFKKSSIVWHLTHWSWYDIRV